MARLGTARRVILSISAPALLLVSLLRFEMRIHERVWSDGDSGPRWTTWDTFVLRDAWWFWPALIVVSAVWWWLLWPPPKSDAGSTPA